MIAAGGTGGHVLPAMALGNELEKEPGIIVEYMGVGLDKNPYFDKCGRTFTNLEGANFSKGLFLGVRKISLGFLTARARLKREKVKRVVGFGSYHSLPVMLAAWSLRIPFDIVELNTFPGKINRYFSRWADRNFIHFDSSKKWLKGEVVPICYSLKNDLEAVTKTQSLASFGLSKEKKVIFIFGGSQGANSISQAWFDMCLQIKEQIQVIHVTPEVETTIAFYKNNGIPAYVSPFIKRMDLAYTAADLAICRAGAGALREMLIYECPAVLIPFPRSKENHQDINATFMQDDVGGAIFLKEEGNLSENLAREVRELFSNDEKKISHMRSCLSVHKDVNSRENLAIHIRRTL